MAIISLWLVAAPVFQDIHVSKFKAMNKNFPDDKYPMQEETYAIINTCMEVHRTLGRGFLEIVYKDAIEHEFRLRNIFYERERLFRIEYKGIILPHSYYADFVVFGQVILEVKAQTGIADEQYKQILNYLAVSICKVGLLINFGEDSLKWKRVIM